ncbi:putative SWI complex, BAF60b domains containing protein [Lyophyllum shimeji]|uniref:SWI complex, BAF60b domains containing protein n=1 Tax=Lyophyllum shimeji TaxID=47721 RepID=A0A9P3PLR4_LYOSH|nr:putative SWI complex, BAF60b domains containing protein [Lyophyllum shimeji]
MAFDFSTLEAPIHKILSAPGTDLTTISAKSVRRLLLKEVTSLTPEFLRENKKEVDIVIGKVFESVNGAQGGGGADADDTEVPERSESRKRKQEDEEEEHGEAEVEGDEEDEARSPKKAKKRSKNELSDAELARQLSDELNARSRRKSAKPSGKPRGANGATKKVGRAKKSAATVHSDEESGDGEGEPKAKSKRKSTGGGGAAKGGFAKEYTLSEPLASLLKVDRLSRPQVVKQLWVHIKDNELQNPNNKREIMCDASMRAVFGVDKIDMFKMNKVLGQHLHENEG